MFTAFLRVAVATSTLLAIVQSQAPNGATGPWDDVNDTFLCTYDPFGQRATLPVSERLAFCTHTSHQTSLHSRAHAHTHSTHTRFSWHHVYLIATSSAVRGTPLYRYPHTTCIRVFTSRNTSLTAHRVLHIKRTRCVRWGHNVVLGLMLLRFVYAFVASRLPQPRFNLISCALVTLLTAGSPLSGLHANYAMITTTLERFHFTNN